MTRAEIIELIVQERLSLYFKENLEHGREEVKRSDEFLTLLKEKAPELAEEFQKYLNWLAEHGGDEQEGIYLFGLHDGIRLMRDIIGVA